LLQLDEDLIEGVHANGFEIAIETNGTIDVPKGIDWICVSPKAGAAVRVRVGDELKLVYPQVNLHPKNLETLNFRHMWLQPMDGPNKLENTEQAVQYCLQNPKWRLSLQTHKFIGIP
jgi:organic radical activating enzyme